MLKIHGVSFSAHTRKVLVTAREKGLEFELLRAIPFDPPPGWAELSPLGLIPVIEDGDYVLSDSSAICAYLERKHPEKPVFPQDARALGRALWLEEFVDGGLAPHVLKGLLMQRVFAPRFLKLAPDQALIERSLTEFIPRRLAYLEANLTGEYFVGGAFSIADVAVVSMLLNFHYAGETLSEPQYPRLHGYLRRMARRPSIAAALAAERPFAEQIEGLDLRFLRSVVG